MLPLSGDGQFEHAGIIPFDIHSAYCMGMVIMYHL